MNSRERILTSLSHREPDRVPYDLGALGPSGISIQAYRNLLKYLHSDGAIYPLIPDIIEMGVEILNPIQVEAKDMGDTRKLKKEFGDTLTFWGSGVDIQHTLPFSTPREVEDEVKRRIEDLAPGGGFVFAATQAIQPETPPENIMAMWKALQSYGIYRGNPD